MNRLEFDIIVVGAGPAGTSFALAMADSGLKIALVDKSRFPRDKICGDALSGKVIAHLSRISPEIVESLSLEPQALITKGITFIAPNGKEMRLPYNKPDEDSIKGFVMERLAFDEFLFKKVADQENLTVIEGFNIQEIEKQEKAYQLSDGNNLLRAKMLIGADGAQSLVAKQMGQSLEKKHFAGGLRQYYENVNWTDPDNFIKLYYLKDILPGYFWIFPLANGRANVGIGMRSDHLSKSKVNLKEKLQEAINGNAEIREILGQAQAVENPKGFGLPLGSIRRELAFDRCLLLGDAGGLIDPFTGEGIGNATISARIAADTVKEAFEKQVFDQKFLKVYETEVYRFLGPELNLSTKLQGLISYPFIFNIIANKVNRNKDLADVFTMMFSDMDMRKKLANPWFYLKFLMA